MEETKKTLNHPLRARMYMGGLKSLFGDMFEMLEEVEKTGAVPDNLIQSMTDVKEAIDLFINEIKKVKSPCCVHDKSCHGECTDNECFKEDDNDGGISLETTAAVVKGKTKRRSSK